MIIDSLQYSGQCGCGREHHMQTLFSIVESGCLKQLPTYLNQYELHGFTVAVYDENTYLATAGTRPLVDAEVILDPAELHANEHGVALLLEQLPAQTELLIAVGSGTIHDITRYCAYQKGIDFVSCPTAASVDGFCSSVAAMTWHGCKKTLTAVAPKIVVADLDIIKNAPIRLAKSGFGDMVGKYVALADWKIANIVQQEFYCETIADMTLQATQAVLRSAEGILRGDEQAYEKLMYGLLLSGLAMQMMGNSRPASGAEHHISHIIEMEPQGFSLHSDALHGEKVGVGTLLAIREYKRLCASTKLSFADYETYGRDQIAHIFSGDMIDEILAENAADAAAGIQKEILQQAWPAICAQVAQIPDADALLALYRSLGVKHRLSDIGVPEEKADALLTYSPAVRNRLTLMRLRKCIRGDC